MTEGPGQGSTIVIYKENRERSMFGLNFKRQGRFADLFLKNLNQRDLSDN